MQGKNNLYGYSCIVMRLYIYRKKNKQLITVFLGIETPPKQQLSGHCSYTATGQAGEEKETFYPQLLGLMCLDPRDV